MIPRVAPVVASRFVLAAILLTALPASAQAPAGRDALMRRLSGQAPPIASATASGDVPAGTIEVLVVDVAGAPVTEAPVRVGMRAQEERDAQVVMTDESGVATFEGLETGSAMAYRVTVPHEGANYGSTPFRLEPGRGHRVRVVRLPTTQDLRFVLQISGQTVIEIKDGRLHIIQSADLANMSDATYVFPSDGLEVPLPEGFTAFQSADLMTDQRMEETDRGYRIFGSLPPGRVTLRWAFDLPIRGENLSFSQPFPFRTHQYMVVADAAEGMRLEVDRFLDAREVEQTEHRFLVSEQRFSPEEPVLESLNVRLIGIPGPGPLRWAALGLAILAILAAFYSLLVPGDEASVAERARGLRREELLEDAEEVQRLHDENEIGPGFRNRRMEEIVSELAELARLDAEAAPNRPSKAKAPRSGANPR